MLLSVDAAIADDNTACTKGVSEDGKLTAGANAGKVADACLAAAARGDGKALFYAGLVMEQGIGRPKNANAAEDWYRKAAKKGEVKATLALGRLAEAKSDDELALSWYGFAAEKRSDAGLKALQRLKTADPEALMGAAIHTIGTDSSRGTLDNLTGLGSGIVLSDRLILTNNHVVAGCDSVAVAPGQAARVKATDKEADLALVETNYAVGDVAVFADQGDIAAGQKVFTAGFPAPGDTLPNFKMTEGMLAGRDLGELESAHWRLTNNVAPGNSGGPLMDETGRVLGVVVAHIPVTGIVKKDTPKGLHDGIAIRLGVVQKFLDAQKIKVTTAAIGPVKTAAGRRDYAAAVSVLLLCFQK